MNNLDELVALFDDDFSEETSRNLEDEATSNGVIKDSSPSSQSKEDLADMEAEYQELQKKMLLLQEKMKFKKESLSENSNQNKDDTRCIPNSDTDPASKRSFCDAFSSVSKISPQTNDFKENISKEKKNSVLKDESPPDDSSSKSDNFYPSQKKPRISHSPQNAFLKTTDKNILPQVKGLKKHQLSAAPNLPKFYETEYFSKIRLKNRFIDANEMKQRMEGKLFLKLSLLRPTMNIAEDRDWTTVAIVSKKMDPQTAKNGKNYSIWHLSDLDENGKVVSFFLFGKVYQDLWKNVEVGTVIGLLNPTIMPPKKDGSRSDVPALTVDVSERVMKIGISADLAWCKATKFRNKQPAGKCLAVINKQFGDVCLFHMKAQHKKMSARRGELQSSSGGTRPAKFKENLWNAVKGDQFFYGGQTFSAAPPAKSCGHPKPESKMKLTDINAPTLSSQSQKSTDIARSKVMQAISGIEEKQSLSGCSDKFAEMLSSGDMIAGSRQFLNHLQKKKKMEEDKMTSSNMSAADFLKQQKKLTKDRSKKTSETSTSIVSKSVEESSEGKIARSASDVLREMKRERFMKQKPNRAQLSAPQPPSSFNSVAPLLGGDSPNDRNVDLFDDWGSRSQSNHSSNASLTLPELRKRKAESKLRLGQVQIKPRDPNSFRIGSTNKALTNEKITRRVEANRKDLVQKTMNSNKVSGKSKLSDDEFKRILNATSSHSNELDLEEIERQEKYFNPLIKKEMLELKMAETFEISTKVVTCRQCDYTFWAPHERCKELDHDLSWRNVKKKFFECTKCKQRTTTWETYPLKACRDCGSEKLWKKTCSWKGKDVKLESETLLVRGFEHSKFLNTLKSGAW